MTREQQINEAAVRYCLMGGIGDLFDTMAGFKAGAEWADQHPHWIPVEEYPKDDISCTLLVQYIDGTIDLCDYYGDFYDYTGENVTRNVTHWMPLPEAPRKED